MQRTREQNLRRLLQIEAKYSSANGATLEEYREAKQIAAILYPEDSKVITVVNKSQ